MPARQPVSTNDNGVPSAIYALIQALLSLFGLPALQYSQFFDNVSPVRHSHVKFAGLDAPINMRCLLQWYRAPIWITVVFKAT